MGQNPEKGVGLMKASTAGSLSPILKSVYPSEAPGKIPAYKRKRRFTKIKKAIKRK